MPFYKVVFFYSLPPTTKILVKTKRIIGQLISFVVQEPNLYFFIEHILQYLTFVMSTWDDNTDPILMTFILI